MSRDFLVGNAHDAKLASGSTAILFDEAAVASADVRGGAPGTRDIDLLQPEETVERIDAVVLSGGSAFGLDAPSGVQAWLREQGRGFAIGTIRVPIVPGAIVFDLLNGGDKDWGRFPPYRDLGYAAAASASADFALGTRGRGLWRHHGQSEGRARLGLRADARRRDRRRDRRGECGRQRDGRRQSALLGGTVRARRRVRRTWAFRRSCRVTR